MTNRIPANCGRCQCKALAQKCDLTRDASLIDIRLIDFRARWRSATGAKSGIYRETAAVLSLDKARIFTRTLAGFAAPLTIWPVAGLRTRVPAFRAGTLRRDTFKSPGKMNSPTPRGCTEPRNTPSNVA